MVITAPTPMTMPSIVNSARNRLLRIDASEIRIVSPINIASADSRYATNATLDEPLQVLLSLQQM